MTSTLSRKCFKYLHEYFRYITGYFNDWCIKILMTNAVSQFIACPKLYIPSSLNIDYILRHLYYRTRAIIGRSRFEAALVYKPRILGLKNEEFPFLVHTLSAI